MFVHLTDYDPTRLVSVHAGWGIVAAITVDDV
jgi:hypothetical protein